MRFNHQVLNQVLAGVAVFVVSSSAVADVLHVPGDYRTIQQAIDAAMDGDEVEVHPGTYFETINFLGKAIRVRSSDGPEVTIIDGGGTTVTCDSGEGPDTVLDGFTVTGGSGIFGGGMLNLNSSPTVTNCTFSGNWAFLFGGGMYNEISSNPTVTNCTFSGNGAGFRGGGMYNLDSSPTVTNSTFSGNMTSDAGGGMYNSGGSPTVTNCIFSANSATPDKFGGGFGGGMFNEISSSPTVTNCTFSGNTAGFSGGKGGSGGGMVSSNATVTNCTFSGNFAFGGSGGGMVSSNATVTNCILWGDSPNEISGATTVRYSDVAGGFAGLGNIDADPLFVDPINGDYRLASGSPCVDAGNNWGVPIDANDYDQDGNTAELFPVDLDGNPRFNADETDFDPGCGVPVVVDMGAYEYQFDPVEDVIFADLNADGAVGILDLLGVLAAWGDATNNCLADLDIDGNVGILDLLRLLSNWG